MPRTPMLKAGSKNWDLGMICYQPPCLAMNWQIWLVLYWNQWNFSLCNVEYSWTYLCYTIFSSSTQVSDFYGIRSNEFLRPFACKLPCRVQTENCFYYLIFGTACLWILTKPIAGGFVKSQHFFVIWVICMATAVNMFSILWGNLIEFGHFQQ